MSNSPPKAQSLTLKNFTAFEEAHFDFCPGINVLIGANATGKSHVMKVIYTILKVCETARHGKLSSSEIYPVINSKFFGVFRPNTMEQLIRSDIRFRGFRESGAASIFLDYADIKFPLTIQIGGEEYAPWEGKSLSTSVYLYPKPENFPPSSAMYLPSQEFLSINEGFIAAYNNRELPYDETYYDLSLALNAAPLRKGKLGEYKKLIASLREIIAGPNTEHYDEVVIQQNGRFYFHLPEGKLEVQLVADGYRKIGTLFYLLRNGSLTKDSILFWDEPEASLNPKLIVEVVKVLRLLAAAGMQIFVATHDYLLSHELSLLAEYPSETNVEVKFFALHRPERKAGVEVDTGRTLAEIEHNPILEEFAAHYDREASLFQELESVGD